MGRGSGLELEMRVGVVVVVGRRLVGRMVVRREGRRGIRASLAEVAAVVRVEQQREDQQQQPTDETLFSRQRSVVSGHNVRPALQAGTPAPQPLPLRPSLQQQAPPSHSHKVKQAEVRDLELLACQGPQQQVLRALR